MLTDPLNHKSYDITLLERIYRRYLSYFSFRCKNLSTVYQISVRNWRPIFKIDYLTWILSWLKMNHLTLILFMIDLHLWYFKMNHYIGAPSSSLNTIHIQLHDPWTIIQCMQSCTIYTELHDPCIIVRSMHNLALPRRPCISMKKLVYFMNFGTGNSRAPKTGGDDDTSEIPGRGQVYQILWRMRLPLEEFSRGPSNLTAWVVHQIIMSRCMCLRIEKTS